MGRPAEPSTGPVSVPAPVEGVADAGLAAWVAAVRAAPAPPVADVGAPALRAAQQARLGGRPPGPDLPLVRTLKTDAGLPVRLYRPSSGPRPLVVYLHGGGFVIGSLDSHDSTCRRLALTADATVLAVDFRLAPEHPGPAAVDDAVAATEWALRHADEPGADPAAGVALAGDSSGGATAYLAAVRLVAAGLPLSALFLACPNADLTLSFPSIGSEGHGWGLEAADLRWFLAQWAPDPAGRTDPALAPLSADPAGLPPTLLATAGHDPLRDEGAALADRLLAAGVPVRHEEGPGLVHGFLGLGHVSPAAEAAGEGLFRRFGEMLRGNPP